MADLGAMREFQKHWEAYVADEQAAALLRTRPPLDVAALSPGDRMRPMLARPDSAVYDDAALRDALGRAQSSSRPASTDAPRDPRWAWWLDDPAWAVMGALREQLAARDAVHAELGGLALEAASRLDADDAYRAARASIASYMAANEEDRVACNDLAARRADAVAAGGGASGAPVPNRGEVQEVPTSAAVFGGAARGSDAAASAAVTGAGSSGTSAGSGAGAHAPASPRSGASASVEASDGLLARLWRRFVFLLFGRRRLREELAALDRRIMDVQGRVDLRTREIARLEQTLAARRTALYAAFDEDLDAAAAAAAAIDERIIALLDEDLARRDPSYERGMLTELSFDEAFAQANAREWDVLASWMTAYASRLPEALERASNIAASEDVWLEGHAPYGRRYWPLTNEVVALMESGRAHASETALKVVLQQARDA